MGNDASTHKHYHKKAFVLKASCVLQSKNVTGFIEFTCARKGSMDAGSYIDVNVQGLTPGLHAIHIHKYGNIRDTCELTSSHYNPYSVTHGGALSKVRHVGDLGNIKADNDGIATWSSRFFKYVYLNGPHSVIGRAIVVHASEDDLGKGGEPKSAKRIESLKTGNAGLRIACGVIGIASEVIL